MIMIKRFARFAGCLAVSSMLFAAAPAAQQPPTEPQGEFLPIDQLPPAEQLPAAPLLVAAYAFAWLAVFFYLWTVWRRLNKVEAELRTLEQRHAHRGEG
jgi:CcmD family protein